MARYFLFLLLLCTGITANAQFVSPKLQYTWAPVAQTGPLGVASVDQYLAFSQLTAGVPQYHTVDFAFTGTPPVTCTFRVEGSSDGTHWYGLDVTSPASESCTTSNMEHIPFKPVRALRITIVSYSAGDGTTAVVFNYTGAR
jgi:hypothetical protein